MLEYLVPSQSRRTLLKLLHVERKRESVSSLAKLAQVSFSTAYAELRAMELAGLAKSEYEGKRVFFRANDDSSDAVLLRSLLSSDNRGENRPSETVLANLERMSGAPGSKAENHQPVLSDEETLALAFKLARRNATVARVLPVALYKSLGALNLEKLKTLCLKEGEKKTLGFFLDLTSELAHLNHLRDVARKLHDNRLKKSESFFVNQPQGKYAKRMEARNTPKVAKRWKFRMNMDFENFRSHFEKFVSLRTPRENLRQRRD
ncbi:MAG: winged helix-turn-helix transcriptional regulator [Deltaproteobacteria bacterium]|nr:winged helix-turn-helix transcriptional regulator [Deltaproteobacteria bacterium]